MVRMPDSPAQSLAQLSVLPAPSEVTTPMPVTTTMGLPNLSRGAAIVSPVRGYSMIRKSGSRFAEKIMLKQKDEIVMRFIGIAS